MLAEAVADDGEIDSERFCGGRGRHECGAPHDYSKSKRARPRPHSPRWRAATPTALRGLAERAPRSRCDGPAAARGARRRAGPRAAIWRGRRPWPCRASSGAAPSTRSRRGADDRRRRTRRERRSRPSRAASSTQRRRCRRRAARRAAARVRRTRAGEPADASAHGAAAGAASAAEGFAPTSDEARAAMAQDVAGPDRLPRSPTPFRRRRPAARSRRGRRATTTARAASAGARRGAPAATAAVAAGAALELYLGRATAAARGRGSRARSPARRPRCNAVTPRDRDAYAQRAVAAAGPSRRLRRAGRGRRYGKPRHRSCRREDDGSTAASRARARADFSERPRTRGHLSAELLRTLVIRRRAVRGRRLLPCACAMQSARA